MAFPICSPHHLSLNGVLLGTISQPKATLTSSARIGVTIEIGEIYTSFCTNFIRSCPRPTIRQWWEFCIKYSDVIRNSAHNNVAAI